MATDISSIIQSYQTRCEQQLQAAEPGSDERLAYERILDVFKRHQTGNPGDRSLIIALELAGEADSIAALPLAPAEAHEQARRVRRIVAQWADNFKRDTGHDLPTFHFRPRY